MRAAKLSVMNILKSGTIWGNEQARGWRALLASWEPRITQPQPVKG